MLRHVYDAAEPLASDIMLATGSTTQISELPDLQRVQDSYSDSGPLAGIHATLRASPNPWLLVVACDLPLVQTATLSLLIEACEHPADAVVCQSEKSGLQPLCACYHQSLLDRMEQALRGGNLGVQRFLRSLKHVTVIDVPENELVNINTVDDLNGA